ncbi:MAG: insulinase family protein, partial [Bacteroidetes bacterium]|nr:insulinase family protein [Bacteroidota bacterium]
MKNFRFLIFSALFISTLVFSQETKISGELDNKIPVDPMIRIGKLDNGLTYYIRKNVKPEKRVEMRLVVNAGSLMEDDDQQGLAHFVEHMAFNGTKNFEKNEIVSYLQSIGVQFGADLNAYTSFDETVYILPIPTDDEEIVNQGLQVLEDWAHNVLLTEEEIDKERGVVVEEWRLGRGANQRMRDQYFPILFKESRYADRLPIGKKEIIEDSPYDAARRFYRDWYRPDLMAVIAIGDIDVDEMEQKIKDHFSGIENPANPRPRKEYEVPDHEETYIVVTSDKEAPFTQIQLYYKNDNVTTETLKEYRRDVTYQLYNGMLNERLRELTQS